MMEWTDRHCRHFLRLISKRTFLYTEMVTAEAVLHDLRTRHAGRTTFIEFHLVVPGTMTVAESHAICDRVEAALKGDLPQAVITIHVEPEEKAKLEGVPVV